MISSESPTGGAKGNGKGKGDGKGWGAVARVMPNPLLTRDAKTK